MRELVHGAAHQQAAAVSADDDYDLHPYNEEYLDDRVFDLDELPEQTMGIQRGLTSTDEMLGHFRCNRRIPISSQA